MLAAIGPCGTVGTNAAAVALNEGASVALVAGGGGSLGVNAGTLALNIGVAASLETSGDGSGLPPGTNAGALSRNRPSASEAGVEWLILL